MEIQVISLIIWLNSIRFVPEFGLVAALGAIYFSVRTRKTTILIVNSEINCYLC